MDQTDLVSLVQNFEKKFFFHFFRIRISDNPNMKEHRKKHTQTDFQPSRVTRELTVAIFRKTNPANPETKIALERFLAVRLGLKLVYILIRVSAFI